jgi:hypothetical protein
MKTVSLIESDGAIAVVNPMMFVLARRPETNTIAYFAGGLSITVRGTPEEVAAIIAKAVEPARSSTNLPPPHPTERKAKPHHVGGSKYELDVDQDRKISAVLSWAKEEGEAAEFDDSFVGSLANGIEKYGSLTEKQEAALDNIIARFKINVEEWSAKP